MKAVPSPRMPLISSWLGILHCTKLITQGLVIPLLPTQHLQVDQFSEGQVGPRVGERDLKSLLWWGAEPREERKFSRSAGEELKQAKKIYPLPVPTPPPPLPCVPYIKGTPGTRGETELQRSRIAACCVITCNRWGCIVLSCLGANAPKN